jgi:hypothetical protein
MKLKINQLAAWSFQRAVKAKSQKRVSMRIMKELEALNLPTSLIILLLKIDLL